MGLFKKDYITQIVKAQQAINGVGITDEDLTLKFTARVKEIEEQDIECIALLKQIANRGHISEKQKRALLNQLVFLLRRLEKIKPQEGNQLRRIKEEIENVLQVELTIERLGIEFKGLLYHGSGIAGIRKFEKNMEEFDYWTQATLGYGINSTNNKKMGMNYAFFRYQRYIQAEALQKKYEGRILPAVYTLKLKKGCNYIADLNDSLKLRAIYADLLEYLRRHPDNTQSDIVAQSELNDFIQYLQIVIMQKRTFVSIRDMLADRNYHASVGNMIVYITQFLKKIGYHGLRSVEGGEPYQSIFPWQTSMTYLIFDPAYIEIVKEEHFNVREGKIVKV